MRPWIDPPPAARLKSTLLDVEAPLIVSVAVVLKSVARLFGSPLYQPRTWPGACAMRIHSPDGRPEIVYVPLAPVTAPALVANEFPTNRIAMIAAPERGSPVARSRIVPAIVPPFVSAILMPGVSWPAITGTGVAVVRSSPALPG